MSTKSTAKTPKNAEFFECIQCDFTCCKKSDYRRHILTRKHKNVNKLSTESTEITPKESNIIYKCDDCQKIYKERTGLWKHKKKCALIKTEQQYMEEPLEFLQKLQQQPNLTNIVLDLVKQNQEFKEMILEQNKMITDLASKTNTNIYNNTTNNNKFNMNIFLNEKCKDALNIMDFVTSLSLNMEDLEETGKQGYVKGLSRILVNGLKGIEVSKRPIHCSDLKRETLYIKDNNVWEKEDAEKKKIKNAIKYISLKNAKQITQWTKENEGYRDSHNKKSDTYLKLVYEANGGDEDELNKIIKNISANVTIDKNELGPI